MQPVRKQNPISQEPPRPTLPHDVHDVASILLVEHGGPDLIMVDMLFVHAASIDNPDSVVGSEVAQHLRLTARIGQLLMAIEECDILR